MQLQSELQSKVQVLAVPEVAQPSEATREI